MAHFAVRGLMHEAALKADKDPDRLSFLHAVRVVRRKLPAFNAIPPCAEESFHERVLEEILQERVVSQPRPAQSARRQAKDEQLPAATSSRQAPQDDRHRKSHQDH